MNKLKEKKGTIIVLLTGIIMIVIMPLMAVIYDLSLYKMYTQDLKNMQDLAGISCVPQSGNSYKMNGCQELIKAKIVSDLAYDSRYFNISGEAMKKRSIVENQNDVFAEGEAKPLTANEVANHVKVAPYSGTTGNITGYQVQIVGLYYRPSFLRMPLFQKMINQNGSTKMFLLNPSPSIFSAQYECQGKCG